MKDAPKPQKKGKKKRIVILVIAALFVAFLLFAVDYATHYEKYKKPRLLEQYSYAENQGRVLLAGSSFMEKWRTYKEDLIPMNVMNVAIGGTKVEHWLEMYEELIIPYNPKTVVIYVGSNDINGGKNSKTGDAVFAQVQTLFGYISAKLPDTDIYYVSIAPTPLREKVWSDAARCNELMQAYCEANENYYFIDCTSALLDADGNVRPELYGIDRLHFNEEGYEIWARVLKEALTEQA